MLVEMQDMSQDLGAFRHVYTVNLKDLSYCAFNPKHGLSPQGVRSTLNLDLNVLFQYNP